MPAAVAVPAIMGAVGIGANIFTGIKGANAAKTSAQIQAEAATKAGQSVIDTTNEVNPSIRTAADYAGAQATKAAGDAGAGVWSSTDRANALLNPFSQAGADAAETLRAGLVDGGTFNRPFTAADIQMDPGFAFRMAEGQKALEHSAAAKGGALGGAAVKAATRYAQDYSSGEFKNAFDRYNTTTQNRYANLFGVAGLGATTSTREGDNLTAAGRYSGDAIQNAAQYSGTTGINAANLIAANSIDATKTAADYNTGAAQARAAGVVGSTNAITGAVQGSVKAATDAATLALLLKNPATSKAMRSAAARYPGMGTMN